MIEFQLLGEIRLRGADEGEVHALLRQPKRLALLAYMVTPLPGTWHRRETLLALFWPDLDTVHARTSLRNALYVLRQILGDDVLRNRGDEEVSVDPARLETDLGKVWTAIKHGRMENALANYRGELLPGLFASDSEGFQRWLDIERARLKVEVSRAALSLATSLERAGNLPEALGVAQRAIEIQPDDETAVRRLITLHEAMGDRAGALGVFESYRSRLRDEFDAEPAPETIALANRLRVSSEASIPRMRHPVVERRPAETTATTIPSEPAAMKEGERRAGHRGRTLLVAGALGFLISAGFIWGLLRPRSPNQVLRYALSVDSSEAMVPGGSWSGRLAISPDGTRLAYIGGPNGELLVRPRNQLRATAIPGTNGALTPFFSPDGQRIGFLGEGHVHMVSANGDSVIAVCDTLTGVAGASWGRDGFMYVDGRGYKSLLRVEAKAKSRPRWFTTLDTAAGEVNHSWPDVLPNGKGVLFVVTFTGTNGISDSLSYAIAVADVPSGKHRVIVNDAKYARYVTSGYLLYITTKKTLMVAPFDQDAMKVIGAPTPVIEGMRLGRFGSADLAVSAAGTLVYATGGGQDKREVVRVTRDGRRQSVDPDWQSELWVPALSPNGKQLAITRRFSGQRIDVWVKQLDRGPGIIVSLQQNGGFYPAWTPDGRSVTFTSDETNGKASFWTSRADGSAPPVLQFRSNRWVFSTVWSPDGKWLVYRDRGAPPDSGDILGVRPGLDTSPVPLVASRYWETTPAVSPDGRWLAYTADESGLNQVYVVPFPNTHAAKWAVSTSGGTDPEWSHRGNELFYRDGAGNLIAVEVKTSPTFLIGRATSLFSTVGLEMIPGLKGYAVTPDDRHFLMIRPAVGPPEKLIVVENWFEELKAKSPLR
jgi:DNA-binding SARP family transcriptional activator/Tol biopolymer transport system component